MDGGHPRALRIIQLTVNGWLIFFLGWNNKRLWFVYIQIIHYLFNSSSSEYSSHELTEIGFVEQQLSLSESSGLVMSTPPFWLFTVCVSMS